MDPPPTDRGLQDPQALLHPPTLPPPPGRQTGSRPAPSAAALHAATQPDALWPRASVTLEGSAVSPRCPAPSASSPWRPVGADTAGPRWLSGFSDDCALSSGLSNTCRQPPHCLDRPTGLPGTCAPAPASLCSPPPSSRPAPPDPGQVSWAGAHIRDRATAPLGGCAPPTTCPASCRSAGTNPATPSTTAEPNTLRPACPRGGAEHPGSWGLGRSSSHRAGTWVYTSMLTTAYPA